METSSIPHCQPRRRPPFRLWFKLADLPKVSIRNLAHEGNRTPVAEFPCHIDGHLDHGPTTHVNTMFRKIGPSSNNLSKVVKPFFVSFLM